VTQLYFRTLARSPASYGFIEWDGPILEASALQKESGTGGRNRSINFSFFTDKGEREVAMRPS